MDPYGKSLADDLDRVERIQMAANAYQPDRWMAEQMHEAQVTGPVEHLFERGRQ